MYKTLSHINMDKTETFKIFLLNRKILEKVFKHQIKLEILLYIKQFI